MKHLLCQLVDVKYGTELIPEETIKHLLKCCEENLGKDKLKAIQMQCQELKKNSLLQLNDSLLFQLR